uniref:histidine kinase n=1 Tax=Candidatus Kentrum sp. FW TaxID=2126338 RepID=A0A450SZZ5_9GAMM|nr:MAG: Signal transduction histidine kinase [Candidatus Kentron sp. FW]
MRRNKKNPKWKQRPGEQTQTLKAAWQQLDDVNNLKSQIIESPRQGKPERAEQRLGYLRQNQGQPDLLAKSLCDLAQQIPQPDWKLALYEEAEELNPFDPVTLNSYATALANAGDTEKAFGLFERSLELKDTEPVTLTSYATALANAGEPEKAFGLFERSLELKDTETVTLNSYATALANAGEPEKAFGLFERSLELKDTETVTLNSYATALANAGEPEKAFGLFERSLELKDTETVTLNSYATALANAGDTEKAFELFERSLALKDTETVTLNSYATALANAGDTKKAFVLFERSLVVEPNDEITLLQFGLFLETQERYDEAIGQLERIRLATVGRRFAGFVCLNLGRLYYRIDEKNRAADWFERAVEYSDDAMASRLQAARNILALRPHSREAVAILQEIVKEMPGHGPALQMLHLNLGLKEQYEQFGRDDEGRDRELLNRAIYHKILNEVATLKMIAYRIVRKTESEELRRVIERIESIAAEIGRRRQAAAARIDTIPTNDYDRLLPAISATAHDIADFTNNEIAALELQVRRLLKTHGNAPFADTLVRLLEQIQLTERGLNDLKTVNEAIRLDVAPFPVRDLFANWQQNPEIGNATISVRMENPDALFHGDEQKLKAILKELVDNSRKHNPDHAKLRIRMMSRDLGTLPNHVLPSKAPPGTSNYLNITYLDDGKGVPTDQKEWVFQPLKTTGRDGSGLGLFIIRKTVRAMRGYVLERGDTCGARLEIYLPYGAEK